MFCYRVLKVLIIITFFVYDSPAAAGLYFFAGWKADSTFSQPNVS